MMGGNLPIISTAGENTFLATKFIAVKTNYSRADMQCWASATFFNSRHRDVGHLLIIAPLHQCSVFSAKLAPLHHRATFKGKNCPTEPYFSKIISLKFFTTANGPVPVILYYS